MLSRCVWAALVCCLLSLPVQAATGNILLLIADDMGVDVTGFYPSGVRVATTPPAPPTPNLAALAADGVLFTRAWAYPLCSPTRAAILTGRYGFRTGIGTAKTSDLPELKLSELILPELFQQAAPNYTLAHIGKWHVSSGVLDPNTHGWPHYAGPTLGRINNFYRWPKVVDGVASTSQVYATTATVNDALAVIQEATAANQRYFLWVAFNASHNPFHKPPNELHSRDNLPTSGAPIRSYYEAMVEALDTEIGRLLQAVDLTTTTVIFVGDNSTPSGVVAKPYSMTKAKTTMYQGGVAVPLVVAGESVSGAGRTVSAPTSVVDLFPTILELGGIDLSSALPAGLKIDGISLLPYLADRAHPSPRSWIYSERFNMTYDGDWRRTIYEAGYKLIERYDGSREFYNVANTPLEKVNLLSRPLTPFETSRLARLDQRLDALIQSR
jgi:arylsulfatase A-like enzyme